MSTRRWPKRFLYSAATRAGAVFIQACHLQELLQLVDAVLLHGFNYNTTYKNDKKETRHI